jgi:hypothetical protein
MNTELNVETGLVASYHFNEGVANGSNTGITIATDASGNGNDGTLNNFALTGATSNWIGGQVPTAVLTNDAPATFAIGNTTVTWTATDAAGNMATCEQIVTVATEQLTWNGSVSSDWNTPNNWTPNVVPSECSKITIPETGNLPLIFGAISVIELNIGNGSTVTVPVGATLNVSGDLNMYSASDSYSGLIVNGTIAIEVWLNTIALPIRIQMITI